MRTQLSKRELEAVIVELATRCKDMAYVNAEKNLRQAFGSMRDDYLTSPSGNRITVSYTYEFSYGDVQQIVGRLRRKR